MPAHGAMEPDAPLIVNSVVPLGNSQYCPDPLEEHSQFSSTMLLMSIQHA
ncbi:UNVERIFIED_CONTAM: hypothetical protein Slati_4174600 [Sesamum latifolium]|uniref:Uncharacterized protein n=1 Tax=Sesamum latifolium TaxID=2727402 RepID=A0AAW2TA35_9LAMI